MTVMLEVAIGLIFVYLVLSLLASAIAEALEHYFHYRADYLRQGIENLLLGGDAQFRARLYAHPLIKSLYTPSRLEGKGRSGGPAYIPSRQFVLALLDIVNGDAAAPAPPPAAGTAAHLLTAIDNNRNLPATLAQALRTLVRDASGDMEKAKANIQEWFDGSMERVAGWYKQRSQFVLLIIGIISAIVINVDTLTIVDTLSSDAGVRTAVVTAAEAYARQNSQAPTPGSGTTAKSLDQLTSDVRTSVDAVSRELGALGLPIGWRYYDPQGLDKAVAALRDTDDLRRAHVIRTRVWPTTATDWWNQFASHLLGWVLTALAISFGAPFWFDTLNKIMVIRSTVKPHEKSGEEGSEDRRPATPPQAGAVPLAGAK